MRKLIYAAGMVVVLAAVLLFVRQAIPSPLPATPSDDENGKLVITWSVPKVSETLFPGTSKAVVVHFSSKQDLSSVAVTMNQIDGEANGEGQQEGQSPANVFTVSPTTFASIAAVRDYQLTVTLTAPPAFTKRTFSGLIQLGNAKGGDGDRKAYPPPLPLTLKTDWNLSWSPQPLSVTAFPGEQLQRTVTFTSTGTLQDVVVEAGLGIGGLLTLQPNFIAAVPAGQPQQVKVLIFIPTSTPLGTHDGTVHITSGNHTFSEALKISILVARSITAEGLTLNYPLGWQPDPSILSAAGPIVMANFTSYEHGGILPSGGGEVDITTKPLPPPPLSDEISRDVGGAAIQSSTTVFIDGSPATQVSYGTSIGPLNYSNVLVYCPHASVLYKFFLYYNSADPDQAQILADFEQILRTIVFTP